MLLVLVCVCVCVGRLRVTVTGAVGLCVIRDLTAIILSAISWMIHWREREGGGGGGGGFHTGAVGDRVVRD